MSKQQQTLALTGEGFPCKFETYYTRVVNWGLRTRHCTLGGTCNAFTFIQKFAKMEPRFRRSPVMRVKGQRLICQQDGARYRFNPELFGLDPMRLIEGQRITFDLDAIKQTNKTRRETGRAAKKAKDLCRVEFQRLQGLPNAVKLARPYPLSSNAARLTDRLGTVVEVRRTRCTVDFGEDGQQENWDIPLNHLVPADSGGRGAA